MVSMKSDGGAPESVSARTESIRLGLGVSPGLAVGVAFVSNPASLEVPEYRLDHERIPAELERFAAAVTLSRHQLIKLREKSAALHGPMAEDVGYLLDAHLAMLAESRLIRGVVGRIEQAAINAESAVDLEIAALAESFALIGDTYLAARIDDIRVVGDRLIRNLTKAPFTSIGKLPAGTALLAEELSPADTALIDPAKIVGFATVLGGAEGHTAIMARALGIPAVLGCPGLLHGVRPGDIVIIDGFAGTVTINPTEETLLCYEVQRSNMAQESRKLQRLRQLPSETRDGVRIELQANLELPRELEIAVEAGAAGIGLVRTEFLFMNRDDPPSEDEQFDSLVALVRGMAGRQVTIRTLDIGGDKLAYSLGGTTAASPNPALGLRAIRFGLKHPALLETQFSAILRAAVEGPVAILLPMISSLSQIRDSRALLEATARRLAARGVRLPERLPPLGIMIEIPGAALVADAFAAAADFFAIGTNDLTQYTLAIDRGDEQVADLYNPVHPAVLRLIEFATAAAARARIPVSVCGEVAGDARYTALLIGLGIRRLSMAPGNLARVKQRLRSLTLAEAGQIARRIMAEPDEEGISKILEETQPA
jgi:phosphotransferase system enzyme I (PtsI)